MNRQKLIDENALLKSLVIPADATPEQARNMITGAMAFKTVNERKRRLRQVRREHGTCQLDQAIELAEQLGYDTGKNWGRKAIAYLMRTDINTVRQLLEPDVTSDDDSGIIDVDQIIADAMKP